MSYEEIKIEYSEGWKGPVRERSSTDSQFLAIFGVVMALWTAVAIYGLSCGDIRALVAPVDSYGRICGFGSNVANASHLVIFDLNACIDDTCLTPQVCREECPTSDWYFATAWDKEPVESIRKNMLCQTGVDVTGKEKPELLELIREEKCAKWYLKSTSIFGRCIPDSVPSELADVTISESKLMDVRKAIGKFSAWGEKIVRAMGSTKGTVLGLIVGAAAISLIHVFLLRWLALPFVIFSIAVLCATFSYLSYYFYGRYKSELNNTLVVPAVFSGFLAGFVVLMALCLFKKIRLACQLIKESSMAVITMFPSMIFPILPALLHLAAIVYFIVTGLYICSIQTFETWLFWFLITIHIVGFIWFYCFVTALGEMILASAFATWYWTFNKLKVSVFAIFEGAWTTIRYHLGTVAFGSLLITICRIIRMILQGLRICARGRGALVFYIIIYCAQICIGHLENFIKFMNRNAYIMCAVYGKGLCDSASTAMDLILRNVVKVIVVNNVVSWVLWLSQVLITVSMILLTWLNYSNTEFDTDVLWVPMSLVGIGSYFVTGVFFNVYVVAVDTIFLCFLEDCERHDGSPSKPYYMSRQLRKLLHKDS